MESIWCSLNSAQSLLRTQLRAIQCEIAGFDCQKVRVQIVFLERIITPGWCFCTWIVARRLTEIKCHKGYNRAGPVVNSQGIRRSPRESSSRQEIATEPDKALVWKSHQEGVEWKTMCFISSARDWAAPFPGHESRVWRLKSVVLVVKEQPCDQTSECAEHHSATRGRSFHAPKQTGSLQTRMTLSSLPSFTPLPWRLSIHKSTS